MKKFTITGIAYDLDGVMADFDGGVKKLTGKRPHEMDKRHMWRAINAKKTFFEELDLMPDAMELWDYVAKFPHLKNRVVTGLPTVNDGEGQKRRWVKKTLCEAIEVIVCRSKDKHLHHLPGLVLIDDRQEMVDLWRSVGGVAILHTSAESTIVQLKGLGLDDGTE